MIKIRDVFIGSDTPKICVPLTSGTLDDLLEEAKAAKASKADLVEWRADYFGAPDEIMSAFYPLRDALGNMPVLFTFRTVPEGGRREISEKDYLRLNLGAALSGHVDLIDIELFSGDELCRDIIAAAHSSKVAVVISSHDFETTPPKSELLSRLRKALQLGGDIPKLAVTPRTPADVLTLLSACEEFTRENSEQAAITISMGPLGKISRVAGGLFGSAVTFAALGTATAPGQLAVEDLYEILRMLHS